MKQVLFAVLLAAACASMMPGKAALAQSARSETIAVVVNEDAISESDVMARMRLIIASSGMPDNPDIREKMQPQVLSMLIEEKLRLQEARRMELTIAPEEVEEGFAAIAAQNNMQPAQFRELLRREGVATRTLEDQIRAQIAWTKVVQEKLRPQILITDNEVDAVLSRLQANTGNEEFRVSEIFLAVENPAQEGDVKKLADRLTGQLADGRTPFNRLAAQFSQAAGASKGGDLGWVQRGQLAPELEEALVQLKEGGVTRPVRTLAGYHILMLRGKRAITPETLPSPDDVRQRIGMERLDRLQRSYLLDLKAQSFIEQRV